ncbi:MAG TPA: IPT/TIG domain-containing protein [Candidatus Limnocylindrales bacterium]|nr:IPT/TIG domain-containing protein [Candidatus Limnocylindrales bacterium]
MTQALRVAGAAGIALALAVFAPHPASAASRTAAHAPAPAPPAARPGVPRVFQVNPATVNLQTQPNIMLVGQNLTPRTRVLVGGREATTVEATGYTLLAKLPDGLAGGSYPLEVVTDGVSSTASDPVVVEDTPPGMSQATMLTGGALVVLLVLVMRLARPRTYAWSR